MSAAAADDAAAHGSVLRHLDVIQADSVARSVGAAASSRQVSRVLSHDGNSRCVGKVSGGVCDCVSVCLSVRQGVRPRSKGLQLSSPNLVDMQRVTCNDPEIKRSKIKVMQICWR